MGADPSPLLLLGRGYCLVCRVFEGGVRKLTKNRQAIAWFALLFVVMFGFFRQEQLRHSGRAERNERIAAVSRTASKNKTDVCAFATHVRNAVLAGQENTNLNPIPIPEGSAPEIAQIINFVNKRGVTTAQKVLDELDKGKPCEGTGTVTTTTTTTLETP